jgi:hypothetical protein
LTALHSGLYTSPGRLKLHKDLKINPFPTLLLCKENPCGAYTCGIAKNIEGFFYKKLSYLVYSQNLAKLFVLDDRHFDYITESLKETLFHQRNFKACELNRGHLLYLLPSHEIMNEIHNYLR